MLLCLEKSWVAVISSLGKVILIRTRRQVLMTPRLALLGAKRTNMAAGVGALGTAAAAPAQSSLARGGLLALVSFLFGPCSLVWHYLSSCLALVTLFCQFGSNIP